MANGAYKQRQSGTETSSFGTPGRINHDSTKFYGSRLYDGLRNGKKVRYIENEIPEKNINKILYFQGRSRSRSLCWKWISLPFSHKR